MLFVVISVIVGSVVRVVRTELVMIDGAKVENSACMVKFISSGSSNNWSSKTTISASRSTGISVMFNSTAISVSFGLMVLMMMVVILAEPVELLIMPVELFIDDTVDALLADIVEEPAEDPDSDPVLSDEPDPVLPDEPDPPDPVPPVVGFIVLDPDPSDPVLPLEPDPDPVLP